MATDGRSRDDEPEDYKQPMRDVTLAKRARRVIAATLRPFGLEPVVERWYWRVTSKWRHDELVPRATFRNVLDRAIARILEAVRREDFGDYLEFGVYNGTSLSIAYEAFSDAGLLRSRFVGFDSFEGMPGSGADDSGTFSGGSLYCDEKQARANLAAAGVDMRRVELVKGWFDRTLTRETARRLGLTRTHLVMIDCVVYSSTVAALAFTEPLIVDSAILIFDDWTTHLMHDHHQGERRAFEEFLAAHPELKAEALGEYSPNGQIFHVTRTPRAGAV